MKSDIDSLLRQYLPLDGGVGINSQARETAAAEAHRKCVIVALCSPELLSIAHPLVLVSRSLVDTASVDSEAGP